MEDSASDSSPTYEKKKLNILVVDDVQSNRKLLCRLLERSGHRTGNAENGAIALEMIKQNIKLRDGDEGRYNCILMAVQAHTEQISHSNRFITSH